MSIAVSVAIVAVLAIPSVSVAATAGGYGGVPDGAVSDTYTFPGYSPATTATLGVTDGQLLYVSDFDTWGGGMNTWGWDGINVNDSFFPASVAETYGLGAGWQAGDSECDNIPSTVVLGQVYECSVHPTVTFTFDQPTTNPIINVSNLAGGGSFGSLWSDYSLQESGTLHKLSSTGNIEVHSNGTSFGVIKAPGTGFDGTVDRNSFDTYPNASQPNMYGAGYGAFMVEGTFTTITFDVTLYYSNFSEGSQTYPITTEKQNYGEWIEFLPTVGAMFAFPQVQTTPVNTDYSGSAVVGGNSQGIYSIAEGPSHGTVTMNEDGTFLYTPLHGYTGQDVFTYQICDSGSMCVESTVTITIEADETLASTGVDSFIIGVFGTSAIALGIAVLFFSTRRRRTLG